MGRPPAGPDVLALHSADLERATQAGTPSSPVTRCPHLLRQGPHFEGTLRPGSQVSGALEQAPPEYPRKLPFAPHTWGL